MEITMAQDRLDVIVSLAKRRGFVYPSSEIYGGLRASWDYGPLGVELKNNVKRQWWRSMVMERDDVVGIDSCVILAKEVWEASGHVETFTDPLTECTSCHKRYRADHLEEAYEAKHGKKPSSLEELNCPNCGNKGKFTPPRQFSGLLKTFLGPVEDESGLAYLRPETAQGIFINFQNVATTARKKPPFGIGESNERWFPYVIEPAAGVDRCTLTFLMDAYTEDEAPNAKGELEKRTVLRLDHRLAPIKVAVLPLSRNADLSPKARDLALKLRKNWSVDFDDAGAIGRRYRRQDEIGTPFCITVDFDTLNDQAVTIRERDSMKQERIGIDQVEAWLAPRLLGC